MKRLLLWVMVVALLLPAAAFGATANVNLKNHTGATWPDLSGVTVRLLDGVGSLVQEVASPVSAQVTFSDLNFAESYTVVVKYQKTQAVDNNGDVVIDQSQTKSLRFSAADETLAKDFFIQNPVASNVLMRASRLPLTWTTVKWKLTPSETSRFNIDKPNLLFTQTVTSGNAELAVSNVPAGRYNWTALNQDESESVSGTAEKTVRTDGTFSINLESVKPITIEATFNLKNLDRSAANFAGETINVVLKNAAGTTVDTQDITASGASASYSSPELTSDTYTITATMCNGAPVCRESTRQMLVSNTPKSSTINFTKLDTVAIDFLVRDSRSSANLTDGSLKIKKSDDTLIEDVAINGATITKNLIHGYSYKIEASSTGHSSRTQNFIPRQSGVKEISLFAQ